MFTPSQIFFRRQPWALRHIVPLTMLVPAPTFVLASWLFPEFILSRFLDGPGNGLENLVTLAVLGFLHAIVVGVISYGRKPYRSTSEKAVVAVGLSIGTIVLNAAAIVNLFVVLFANWHGC